MIAQSKSGKIKLSINPKANICKYCCKKTDKQFSFALFKTSNKVFICFIVCILILLTPAFGQTKKTKKTKHKPKIVTHEQIINKKIYKLKPEQFQQHLAIEVNKHREKVGVTPLLINNDLCNLANQYAKKIADKGIEHEFYYGFETKIIRSEYNKERRIKAMGENVVFGQNTISEIVTAILSDKEKKEILLEPVLKDMGIGFAEGYHIKNKKYGFFIVQFFGAKRDY